METMSGGRPAIGADDGDATCDPQKLIDRLRQAFLPELQSLLNELNFVKWKMGLQDKPNPAPNELRMLKFSAGVQHIIRQLETCVAVPGSDEQVRALLSLEDKISSSILPVKAKMLSRFEAAVDTASRNAVSTQGYPQGMISRP